MDFMSWTLNAPSSNQFNDYKQKIDGEWTVIDENAPLDWSDNYQTFVHMFDKYHEKITALGLHEFGVWIDGSIYDFRISNTNNDRGWENGEPILNDSEDEIINWCPTSLRYLMDTYTDTEYGLQFICFGQKVDRVLHLNRDSAQETFVRQVKKIAELYREQYPAVKTIELDFEKTYTLNDGDPIYYVRGSDETVEGYADGDDWEVYRDFIVKVKNEVCIPLGMKLRVNMYAMTGDWNPQYYGWHDYKTLASGTDMNGNQAIDEFQLMTYDFSWSGSAPGPSTPNWWLEDVLNHVQESLPPENTWIGNAGYGRRWGLDDQQPGSTVTYKQLVMWQNGMYLHNHNGGDNWIWHYQDWLPFTGFNDEESNYQITYPHLYDKFDATMAETVENEGTINRTTYAGRDIITSYFKTQQPIITGVKSIINEPNNISGNVSEIYSDGLTIPEKYLGEDTDFSSAKRPNRAVYQYEEDSNACVAAPDETGENGKLYFDFSLSEPGNYKLIAIVHFNSYQNTTIESVINGNYVTIGGSDLEEWWPFVVDRHAWLEVGEFDFEENNSIEINISTGYLWGFIVCEEFDQNFIGGQVGFNSYLAPFKKRSGIDDNDRLIKEDADMPEQMTLTGEIIRREPRPAVIFEDSFTHYLNRDDVREVIEENEEYNISQEPYYLPIGDQWDSGENVEYYEPEDSYACTDSNGIYRVGFSGGGWNLNEDGVVKASVSAGNSNQLVLYKKFNMNIQVTADFAIDGDYPLGGVRFLATEEGNGNQGYLALLDYSNNKVSLVYEDGNGEWEEIAYEWMSDTLIGMKGESSNLTVSVFEGTVTIAVGDRTYLDQYELPHSVSSGSYGVFIKSGTMTLNLITISSIDRYEPLEKLQVEVDGETFNYGEVPRNVDYDKYGYLIYSGLDIDSTEIETEEWDEDYLNEPLAVIDSWRGRKQIKVRMVDAGIWFSQFYIGDTEGYSVSWNSDLEGFITTSQLIEAYKCRGIAMWTMGQEDPMIFEYLPTI